MTSGECAPLSLHRLSGGLGLPAARAPVMAVLASEHPDAEGDQHERPRGAKQAGDADDEHPRREQDGEQDGKRNKQQPHALQAP